MRHLRISVSGLQSEYTGWPWAIASFTKKEGATDGQVALPAMVVPPYLSYQHVYLRVWATELEEILRKIHPLLAFRAIGPSSAPLLHLQDPSTLLPHLRGTSPRAITRGVRCRPFRRKHERSAKRSRASSRTFFQSAAVIFGGRSWDQRGEGRHGRRVVAPLVSCARSGTAAKNNH